MTMKSTMTRMKRNMTKLSDLTIDMEYLDSLHEKNEFSGFDRSESVPIIRRLIKELRSLAIIADSFAETIKNVDAEALKRAKFEDENG